VGRVGRVGQVRKSRLPSRASRGRVALNRALSKLGMLSRTQATEAICAGRISVNGRIVRDPAHLVVPELVHIMVDAQPRSRAPWRAIVFHKPRGVVTTRRDPEGRRTVFDVLGDAGRGLIAVGRLDAASTGLLLLASDTQLADWISDPDNAISRVYLVTVRGEVTPEAARDLPASAAIVRKGSKRESHLIVELRRGRNREIRRMFDAIGREVTRLRRVKFGRLELENVAPGEWRELTRDQVRAAFPQYPGWARSGCA
jgi:23S rRNA pseudouridine2605 synthase